MAKTQPLYRVVYDSLLNDITDGTLPQGSRIPSESELTLKFNVSRITTKKALNTLAEEGYIIRRAGLGSFVKSSVASNRDEAAVSSPQHGSGSSKIIGLVMEDFTESYGLGILRAIEQQTYNTGYHLCICRSHGSQDVETDAINKMLELNADGIIIMPTHGTHYNTELLKMVIGGYPIVFIDRLLGGIPAPYVGTDNASVSTKLTEYLFDMGHRNIALVTPTATEAAVLRDRIEGFRAAYHIHGLEQDRNLILDSVTSTIPGKDDTQNRTKDAELIESFLREHPEITAVMATEYSSAVMVRQATQRMGLRIPDDISLTCFDSPKTLQGEYYFTHIAQRENEIGECAVNLLIEQLSSKPDHLKQAEVILDADIINGFSVKMI